MSAVASELDSQLSIAKGSSAPLRSAASSTLLSVPSDLEAVRHRVFELRDAWTWSAAKHELYWPFVSNQWVPNTKERSLTKKNTRAQYWYCRLWAKPVEESEGTGQRMKTIRSVVPCKMRLKKVFQYDASGFLQSVNIMPMGECRKHNHDLDYVDQTKINDGVQSALGREVHRGYRPAHINRNIQGVKFEANHAALKAAGGLAMDLKTVHNAGADFLRANPDPNRRDNDLGWRDQMEACYEDLQRMGEGVVSEKLMATRQLEKKRDKQAQGKRKGKEVEEEEEVEKHESHAIAFANRGLFTPPPLTYSVGNLLT